MNTILVILLVLAMIATVVALIRGIIAFLKTTEAELKGEDGGPSTSSIKQNRAMMSRIMFQGVAVVIVVLLLLSSGRN